MKKFYFIILILISFSVYAQDRNQYRTIEEISRINFQYMSRSKFNEIFSAYKLKPEIPPNNYGNIASYYRGKIDGLDVFVWGFFSNDNKNSIDNLTTFGFEIKPPNTSEERFALFEIITDFLSVRCGAPNYSLFKDAQTFLSGGFQLRKGFKGYTQAKNYKELIIQSESTLIGEGFYYNDWEWDKTKGKIQSGLIGDISGRVSVKLDIDKLGFFLNGNYDNKNNTFSNNQPKFSLELPVGIVLSEELSNNNIKGFVGTLDDIICQLQVIDIYTISNLSKQNIQRKMLDYDMYSKESLDAAFEGLVKSTIASSPYGDVINIERSIQKINNVTFIYIKYDVPDTDGNITRKLYNFLVNGYNIVVVGLYFSSDKNASNLIDNYLKSIKFN